MGISLFFGLKVGDNEKTEGHFDTSDIVLPIDIIRPEPKYMTHKPIIIKSKMMIYKPEMIYVGYNEIER